MYRIAFDMLTIATFFTIADRYSEATRLAEATLSSKIFNDGKRLTAIRNGADVGVRRLEIATTWLSNHWPDDLDWPEGVDRPAKQIFAEAAE